MGLKGQRAKRGRPVTASPGSGSTAAAAARNAGDPSAAATFCVEVGAVRIYADSAADVRAVLEPLLQMASQKNLAQLLGISTRTVQRWQRSGRVPAGGGHLLSQVIGRLGTGTNSGS